MTIYPNPHLAIGSACISRIRRKRWNMPIKLMKSEVDTKQLSVNGKGLILREGDLLTYVNKNRVVTKTQ
jgi:hypothetical protein